MKKSYFARTVCAVGISAAFALSLAGCTSAGNASGSATGGVAATVDGVEISEDTITNYIESVRSSNSLTDEAAWGEALAQASLTPATYRESIVNTFVTRELIKTKATEKGVTVDSSEVDSYIDQMKANYDDDAAWQEALTQAGMTEDDYRAEIELQLKSRDLYATFLPTEDPSAEDQIQYAQMYASAYDGAKRSSHILFAAEDTATAQEVLDKINAGELDFTAAVKEYSKDTTSAQSDGDVGWDKTASLDSGYTDGLAALEKDQVSGLVTSQFGIHIIKCTDVFNAPKEKAEDGTETVTITSPDQIPSEWLEDIKDSLNQQKQSEAYSAWLEEVKESSNVVINDMPSGLPYDVDMSQYETTDNATSTTNADGSSSVANEDGTVTTTYPDGTWTVTSADGATITTYNADGTVKSESGAEASTVDQSATASGSETQQPAEAA